MGKYKGVTFTKDTFQEVLLDDLLHIGNELAEANRLKRIVIEHQYFSMKLEHGGFGYDKKGLDDLLRDKV